MKITIEPTTTVVELESGDGNPIKARVWTGVTDKGVPCQLFIARVAVEASERAEDFTRELEEQAQPRAAAQSWPLRMILD